MGNTLGILLGTIVILFLLILGFGIVEGIDENQAIDLLEGLGYTVVSGDDPDVVLDNRQILDGDGVAGGGDLSANRTLSVDLLLTGADADSVVTSSDSGMQFAGGFLTLVRGCSDAQVMEWNETADEWGCGTDNTGSGGSAVAFDFDGVEQSSDTTNIDVVNDTNGIVTETSPDNFEFDFDVAWVEATTLTSGALTEQMLKAVDTAVDEQCLTYESTVGDFEWQTCDPVGSANAEEDNSVVVTNSTAFDFGTGFDVTDDGGEANVTLDFTEHSALVWSAGGSSSFTWTFDVSGVDTAITFGSGTINIATGQLQHAGVDVVVETRDIATSTGLSGGGDLSSNRTLTIDTPYRLPQGCTNGQGTVYATGAGTWGCNTFATAGSLTTLKEATVQVGDADIVTLNFNSGFDLVESPNTTVTVSLDFTEVSLTDDSLFLGSSSGLASATAIGDCDAANDALTYDTTANAFSCNTLLSRHSYSIGITGVLTTSLDFESIDVLVPYAATIVNMICRVATAPTDASILVDLHVNGTTIFSTQSNRVTIAATEFVDTSGAPNTTSLSAGDYLNFDIDQVGSTIAGADISCMLNVTQVLVN